MSAVDRLGAVLMSDPTGRHYGYDMLKRMSRRDRWRLYPLLAQFMKAGWLTDGWDDSFTPARRWYRLTAAGRSMFTPPPTSSKENRTTP